MRFPAAAATTLGCLVVLGLSACSGADPEPLPAAPVLVPGAPGEPARVLPSAGPDLHQDRSPTEADVRYVTMMIPHHEQAITMTDLVADRASDRQVRVIAGRIADAQSGEIGVMRDWLFRYGTPGEHQNHDTHGPMPGMATPGQIDALRAANGPDFDRLFLDLMIAHHEGALTMAEQELAQGVQTRAIEMAQDVIASQSSEIERMRVVRDG